MVELNTAGVEHLEARRGRTIESLRLRRAERQSAGGRRDQRSELCEAFEEQVNAMAAAGAEGIVIETMSEPAEAEIAIAAASKTGLTIVASMAYDAGRKKDRTMTGATPDRPPQLLSERARTSSARNAAAASSCISELPRGCARRPASRSGSKPTPGCRKWWTARRGTAWDRPNSQASHELCGMRASGTLADVVERIRNSSGHCASS